jgi:hypothetical protein
MHAMFPFGAYDGLQENAQKHVARITQAFQTSAYMRLVEQAQQQHERAAQTLQQSGLQDMIDQAAFLSAEYSGANSHTRTREMVPVERPIDASFYMPSREERLAHPRDPAHISAHTKQNPGGKPKKRRPLSALKRERLARLERALKNGAKRGLTQVQVAEEFLDKQSQKQGVLVSDLEKPASQLTWWRNNKDQL